MTLSISDTKHYYAWSYAECSVLFTTMLCVIMLNVVILSVVMVGVMAPLYVLETAAESL
jgi:hypothetical protein